MRKVLNPSYLILQSPNTCKASFPHHIALDMAYEPDTLEVERVRNFVNKIRRRHESMIVAQENRMKLEQPYLETFYAEDRPLQFASDGKPEPTVLYEENLKQILSDDMVEILCEKELSRSLKRLIPLYLELVQIMERSQKEFAPVAIFAQFKEMYPAFDTKEMEAEIAAEPDRWEDLNTNFEGTKPHALDMALWTARKLEAMAEAETAEEVNGEIRIEEAEEIEEAEGSEEEVEAEEVETAEVEEIEEMSDEGTDEVIDEENDEVVNEEATNEILEENDEEDEEIDEEIDEELDEELDEVASDEVVDEDVEGEEIEDKEVEEEANEEAGEKIAEEIDEMIDEDIIGETDEDTNEVVDKGTTEEITEDITEDATEETLSDTTTSTEEPELIEKPELAEEPETAADMGLWARIRIFLRLSQP